MKRSTDLGSSLIHLLATQSMGLPIIALVADVVAADARFNHWIAFEGKRILTEDELLQTAETYESVTDACRVEVERFVEDHDSDVLETILSKTLRTLEMSTGRKPNIG